MDIMNLNEEPQKVEIVWEHYLKTEFGNNIFIGFNRKTKEFTACSDASPWFFVPPDKQDRVEAQIKYMLEAYKEYRQKLQASKETAINTDQN